METVYSYYLTFSGYIWDERIWFPPGVNWTTLRSTDHEKFPDFEDMYYPIAYAFVVLAIRTVFEWSIARPLGIACGIEDTSSELENVFQLIYRKFVALKQRMGREFSAEKKPFFWDTAKAWYGYPFDAIPSELWWYYMIEASFYWALMISQFVDVHRKDFAMNFVHHFATIALLWFSWADNFVQLGSMVLVCHDANDFLIEAAKMARYSDHVKTCNSIFAVFTIVWFLTRLVFFPFWIIYSGLIEAPALVGFYAAYYIFNVLLFILLVLHILWTVMIVRIMMYALQHGEANDVRSDDEDDDDEEDDDEVLSQTTAATVYKKETLENGDLKSG